MIPHRQGLSAAHHAMFRHRQGPGAWMAIQNMQRQRQIQAALLPPLRTAVTLAGAPELAAELDDSASSVAVLLDRLRSLPEERRRQLRSQAQAAAEALAALAWEMANFPGGRLVSAAMTLHAVVLWLLTLVESLRDE